MIQVREFRVSADRRHTTFGVPSLHVHILGALGSSLIISRLSISEALNAKSKTLAKPRSCDVEDSIIIDAPVYPLPPTPRDIIHHQPILGPLPPACALEYSTRSPKTPLFGRRSLATSNTSISALSPNAFQESDRLLSCSMSLLVVMASRPAMWSSSPSLGLK